MSGPGGQEGSLWFTTDVETGLFELMARAEAEVLPEGRVVRIDSRDGDQSSTITLASIEPGPLPWVYRLRVLGQWFDGIRFYAAASSPRRSRRTWAGLR